MVLFPIMLQTLLGYPAVQAGIAMAPRGLGGFLMMQITGMMIGHFDARKLLTTGMLIAGSTLFWLSTLNLQAGYWDFFWPQLVQGVSMSLLFVPLTTVTMDPIPRSRIGNATSLYNLMRNLGGSFGIAVTSTMLTRQQQAAIAQVGSHVTAYDPASQATIAHARAALVAAGSDPATASNRAWALMFGEVQRQASMIAFVRVFQIVAVLFVMLIPLVLLMRRPQGGGHVTAH
jgi:DHA2 family multidrug resistance protein